MRKVSFNVLIPEWLPEKKELQVYWKTFLFRTFGTWMFKDYKCKDCGDLVEYCSPEFESLDDYRKCMVSNSFITLCRKCLARRIHEWYNMEYSKKKQYDHYYDYHCDLHGNTRCNVCGHKKPLQTIISSTFLNLRFGMKWWNGHYICEDCLVNTVLNGRLMNKMSINLRNGKKYRLNEIGAIVSGK